MTDCRKCGLPLIFKRLPSGKWYPMNPDGSEHWDLCKATAFKNMTPEEKAAVLAAQKLAGAPRRTFPTDLTHIYSNPEVAPWDDSLGEFRDFTDSEKLAGIVCEAA